MKRTFLLIALALAGSAAVVMTAGATSTATPGVTAKTILLEGTFPLSGPASGYAPIPAGMGAYFSYANAHGGVNGRKIVWKYEDDGYNPANTVQVTHKFVEQDHAFALVGGLGTEPQHGGPPVPERQQGAAAVRLDGRDDVRPRQRPSTRGRSAGSRTTRRRA